MRATPRRAWPGGAARSRPEPRPGCRAARRAAKARQATLASRIDGTAKAEFWDRRRPRYLFSGLMRCGVCGGGFTKISLHHFSCSTARNKGTCINLLTIRRDMLEAMVQDALRHRLMDPELFTVFVTEFTAEWNRLQADAGAGLAAKRSELAEVGGGSRG